MPRPGSASHSLIPGLKPIRVSILPWERRICQSILEDGCRPDSVETLTSEFSLCLFIQEHCVFSMGC